MARPKATAEEKITKTAKVIDAGAIVGDKEAILTKLFEQIKGNGQNAPELIQVEDEATGATGEVYAYEKLSMPDKLVNFTVLDAAIGHVEKLGKALTEEWERLEKPLREEMAEAGMQNTKVNGVTVYIHSSLIAGTEDGVAKDAVANVLRATPITRLDPTTAQPVEDSDDEGTEGGVGYILQPAKQILTSDMIQDRLEAANRRVVEAAKALEAAMEARVLVRQLKPGQEEIVREDCSFLVQNTVNYNSLNAWVKENLALTPLGDPVIPPELSGIMRVVKKPSLRTRKS